MSFFDKLKDVSKKAGEKIQEEAKKTIRKNKRPPKRYENVKNTKKKRSNKIL